MSQSQRQPQSLTPRSGAGIHPEVRVRFTLADGLAVLLRRPPNSFGWVGAGTVRFEDHGASVTAMGRPWFGLRRRRRFISAFEIRAVYREGCAVRVDLRAPSVERPFFWFWAEDAAAAATVVKRLAPKQSVELDDSSPERPARSRQPRGTWIPAATLTLALLLLAAAMIWLTRPRYELPIPARVEQAQSPSSSAQTRSRASQADLAEARMQLDRFDGDTSALQLEFSMSFDALQRGNLSQEDFINRLDRSLVPQWEAVQRKLSATPPPIGPAAASVREALTRSAVKWQWALRIYAAGLRVHDSNVVLIAFEHFREAADARRQAEARLHEFARAHPG